MKDLNTINRKTKAAAVLILVTILLLISNYFIALNSKKTNENIQAIYNDRLLVSHYIFQYTNVIHEIKSTASDTLSPEKQKFITGRLQSIKTLNKKYLTTVLTAEEKRQFALFRNQCAVIETLNQKKNWKKTTEWSTKSLQTLEILAQIQIDEGKTALTTANTLHNGNQIFTQLDIGLFIILGCLSAYLLVLKKMKVKIKIPEAPSMN